MIRASIILMLLTTSSCFGSQQACSQLLEEESNEFNRLTISSICNAKPETFKGIFVDLGQLRLAIPSAFVVRSFADGELAFSLRSDLALERSRFTRVLIAGDSSSLLELAQSFETVKHPTIDRFKNNCNLELLVNRMKVFVPGASIGLNLTEATVGGWILRTNEGNERLLFALLEASRQMICK